ncbi:HERC2-like protein [Mya arenaria]|uniref:HERC2-like protein n=1 Tax=Mya arenaria TaxID=6604 RepID=A0ABY7DUA9_MYAAR|nr:HERC2-like protein [Mya arenaria]
MEHEANKSLQQMLAETKENLEDIQSLNKQILEAFDLLEGKHFSSAGRREDNATSEDQPVKHGELESVPVQHGDLRSTHVQQGKPDGKRLETDAQENEPGTKKVSIAQTVDIEKDLAKQMTDSDRQVKPKGILKQPSVGKKFSFEFMERFDLTEEHVVYGSMLRRQKVELHQDNRLCERFDHHPNIGHVYEFKEKFKHTNETNSASRPAHDKAKTETDAKEIPRASTDSVHLSERKILKARLQKDGKKGGSPQQGSERQEPPDARQTNMSATESSMQRQKPEQAQQPRTESLTVEKYSSQLQPFGQMTMKAAQAAVVSTETPNSPQQFVLSQQFHENIVKELCKDLDPDMRHHLEELLIQQGNKIEGEKSGESDNRKVGLGEGTESGTVQHRERNHTSVRGGAVQHREVNHTSGGGGTVQYGEAAHTSGRGGTAQHGEGNHTSGACTPQERQDSPESEEVIETDPAVWVQYANQEKEKGALAQKIRENGMDTIICLDVSGSMRGHAWDQAVEFVRRFVECIQNTTVMDNDFEHLSLVTFGGSSTRVQQHLTCDYLEILRKLGQKYMVNKYKIMPRVFLVTDGKATPAGLVAGPDQQQMTLSSANLLEELAKVTKGAIVSPDDWRIQSSVFKNYAQCEEFLRSHSPEADSDSDCEDDTLPPLGSRVQRCVGEASIMANIGQSLGTVTKHMDDGHVGVTWDEPNKDSPLREKVRYSPSQRDVVVVNTPRHLHNEIIAVGCRVRRGADWCYPDQDGGAGNLGNVYHVGSNGIIKVRWDCGYKDRYKFGAEGKFELEVVTEDRQDVSEGAPVTQQDVTEDERIAQLNKRNLTDSTINTGSGAQWHWLEGETWRPYPDSVSKQVEDKYMENPRGTVIINVNGKSCRVLLSRMEQVDIATRTRCAVERRAS